MTRKIFISFLILLAANISIVSRSWGWTVTANFELGVLGAAAEGSSGLTLAREEGSPWNTFDSTRAHSGTKSMKTHFVAGDTGSPGSPNATGGHLAYPSAVGQGGDIWARIYIYTPTYPTWSWWSGSGSNAHIIKVFRAAHVNGGYLSIFAWSPSADRGEINLSNEVDGQGNHERGTNVYFDHGQWQCLEMYVHLHATAGQGIFRIWKNGILIRQETNYRTLASASDTANEALVWTYWNDAHPQNQDVWVDDIIITTDTPAKRDAAGNPMIGPTDWGGLKIPTPPRILQTN